MLAVSTTPPARRLASPCPRRVSPALGNARRADDRRQRARRGLGFRSPSVDVRQRSTPAADDDRHSLVGRLVRAAERGSELSRPRSRPPSDPVYPVNSCSTQIFERRTKTTLLRFLSGCSISSSNAVLSTDCRLQQMLTLIQSQVATTSDTTEVVTKNQKGALTSEHSTDLFSVHNFDVTIDLAFPSGE